MTNDYTGDPLTTMWSQIDVVIPTGPSGGFASGFTPVDNIDVSCVDGPNVVVAFRYEANDNTGNTTRYHIDDIQITGN